MLRRGRSAVLAAALLLTAAGQALASSPAAGQVAVSRAAAQGGVWNGTAQARSTASRTLPAKALLVFYDATGRVLARVDGPATQLPAGAWSGLPVVTGLAPRGTTRVGLAALTTDGAAAVRNVSLTVRSGAPAPVLPPLSVSGNRLRDATGPLVLRGVHRYGGEGDNAEHSGRFPSATELAALRSWGANSVRISVSAPLWLPGCGDDQTYRADVTREADQVTALGMVAVIDLHMASLTGSCTASRLPLPPVDQAVLFWTSAGTSLGSNPLVVFELWNEPHGVNDATWANGGTVTAGGKNYQGAGMAQLLAAVRAAAPSSVVIADGPQYAGEPPTNALADPAVVYGAHAYTCPSAVGAPDCKPNPYSAASALAGWDAFATSHPVAVTEFGWPAPGDGRYDASVISYAERRGWGWIAFAWDGTTVGTFDLLADTTAYEPTVTGQAVLRGLSVNRGAAGPGR